MSACFSMAEPNELKCLEKLFLCLETVLGYKNSQSIHRFEQKSGFEIIVLKGTSMVGRGTAPTNLLPP